MIKEWLLPDNWSWSAIEGIASTAKYSVVDGPFGSSLKTSDYVLDGIPVLQGKNITDNYFRWFDIRFISDKKATELYRSRVLVGDVLMVKIGSIGYAAEITDLREYPFAIIPANLAKITINEKIIDKKFFLSWLASTHVRRHLYKVASKTAQPALSLGKIKALPVPVPPLREQKRIAAILDKADAIRRKRQQAINLADQFLRSVFLDMFGDPLLNQRNWDTKSFLNVGTLDRGVSKHRPRNDPDLLGGKHPLIQTGDVANSNGYIYTYKSTYSDLGLAQSRKWPKGTLCITIAANIAKTGILNFDACFPDSVVGFTPNQCVTVEYVQYWLGFLQKTLESNAPESAQKNINLAILRDLSIPVPRIELQRRFSITVQKVIRYQSTLAVFSNQASELFGSLSRRAFSGEL